MEQSKIDTHFIPVSLKKIRSNTILNFDLYIKGKGKYLLYRNKNLEITSDDLEKIKTSSIMYFYIHQKDKKIFRDYLETNIKNILDSRTVPIAKKAEALYESTVNVVEDIFANPRSGETIKRSKKIISHTVDFIVNIDQAFANLLKIRKHDYYTYTHSVNVCTFLVSLAQNLGITDQNILLEIGEGGLLHDLGKSQVPAEIINKTTGLTDSEWEIMRKHPAIGVQISKETRKISEISLTIIGQHHEKMTGNGYPQGLSSGELSLYAKMASIVDIYDAITTDRSYSQAKPALDAGKILIKLKDDLDENIMKTFLRMLVVEGEK